MSKSVEIPPPGDYVIDPGRSRITFSGRHLFGLAPVRGRFAINSGRIRVANPVTGSVAEAQIDATSFDTGNRMRDSELKSSRFLDVDRYPEITFRDGHVRETRGGWVLEGTLTVHDVANNARIEIERATVSDGEFTVRGTTRIDRGEFGITTGSTLGGREFDLALDVTARLS
ncbi:MAG: hypothetical protein JWQ81_6203 [Amycolatopsis sp.]|uniref:YceI family protein n=1 Tax=Amycolatopsis sp. TaxID=37632 RepID=UPI0026231DDC|nr:YceI family protein [Amycolatopsis sp.]MCU1685464.1 hypothetical protein [Amycolatopsis sp.]